MYSLRVVIDKKELPASAARDTYNEDIINEVSLQRVDIETKVFAFINLGIDKPVQGINFERSSHNLTIFRDQYYLLTSWVLFINIYY